MILLITLLYIIIDYKFKIIPEGYLLIYFIFLGFYKGLISKNMKEVFNLESTNKLFTKYGPKSTLSTFLSIVLILAYDFEDNLYSLSVFDVTFNILLIAILFRFILWGIEKDAIKN